MLQIICFDCQVIAKFNESSIYLITLKWNAQIHFIEALVLHSIVSSQPVPPGFSLVISDGGATPTVGQSYTLICSVSGGTVSSYQWRKDGAVLQGQTTEVLSFSPLRLSDAGRYSCEVSATATSETFTTIQNRSITIHSELIANSMILVAIANGIPCLTCSSSSNIYKYHK